MVFTPDTPVLPTHTPVKWGVGSTNKKKYNLEQDAYKKIKDVVKLGRQREENIYSQSPIFSLVTKNTF